MTEKEETSELLVRGEEKRYLSKMGYAQNYKIGYNEESDRNELIIETFVEFDGCSCFICGLPIQDKTYFCSTQKIFMHRDCLIDKHKPSLTSKKPEHYDHPVFVILKLKNGNEKN